MEIILFILLIFLSYILGSVPFGLLISKIFGYGDIRSIGSGNIGATNVLRTGNKKIAFIVLLLDFFKCYLPTILIFKFVDNNIAGLCGLFSILGHIYPIWLKFKGGKGVACLFGFVFAINPIFFLVILAIWIFIVLITRFSSMGSIISTITTVFLFFIYESNINIVIPLTIALVIIFQHRGNIKRLLNKTENKIKL